MEFINSEEFLKQDNDIKREFINWWKPSIGDLFIDTSKVDSDIDIVYCVPKNNKHFENYNGDIHYKESCLPLLSEGQLRHFIEEKIGCKIEVVYVSKDLVEDEKSYYRIERTTYLDGDINNSVWQVGTNSLIEAYWQVACRIAIK